MRIDRLQLEHAVNATCRALDRQPGAEPVDCVIGTANGYLLILRAVRLDVRLPAELPVYEAITDE
jgi:hypothetical protein